MSDQRVEEELGNLEDYELGEEDSPRKSTEESKSPSQQTSSPPPSPRVIGVRGEIEITVSKILTRGEKDDIAPAVFMVTLLNEDQIKEGSVTLSSKKVRQLLRLLNLQGV